MQYTISDNNICRAEMSVGELCFRALRSNGIDYRVFMACIAGFLSFDFENGSND